MSCKNSLFYLMMKNIQGGTPVYSILMRKCNLILASLILTHRPQVPLWLKSIDKEPNRKRETPTGISLPFSPAVLTTGLKCKNDTKESKAGARDDIWPFLLCPHYIL